MRTTLISALVGLLLAVAPARARGADAMTAREHFEKGTTLYDLGQFRDAAREYEAAYKLKSDPALLYNIGQAYRFAGDAQGALLAYRAYLRRVPDAGNRREVEAHIAKLQRLVDEQRATTTAPPTGTMRPGEPARTTPPPAEPQPTATAHPAVVAQPVAARPAERTPVYKRWWLWTVVGVVVAGAVVTGAVVATTPNDAPSPPNTFGVSLH
jgi:tetratricopeptide (TPR) repeat protein